MTKEDITKPTLLIMKNLEWRGWGNPATMKIDLLTSVINYQRVLTMKQIGNFCQREQGTPEGDRNSWRRL